jgi:uncharacterized membrane protein
MEAILFIGIVIIIIVLLSVQSAIKDNNNRLRNEISSLDKKLAYLKTKIEALGGNNTDLPDEKLIQQKAAEAREAKRIQEERERVAELARQQQENILLQKKWAAAAEKDPIAAPSIPLQYNEPVVEESWWAKWLLNNPDLEKFIGENLINKIGIAILVLGIGFFVKYAIDQNWIKEWGRVSIGIACGALLIGIAHYLRNGYKAFSSVLVGGGLAIFYFTIAFAFHQYNLISQTPAFIIMVAITLFAVILSLLYDRLEIAVLAAIGGFIAPFLVSNGAGNYIVLFSYLLILNIGLLSLSYFKKWPLLNIIALFFTVIIYGAWAVNVFYWAAAIVPPYEGALLFALAYYLLFLAMNMIYNIRNNKPFKAIDFIILLMINCSFYSAGIFILSQWHGGDYNGLFTISVAAINFALAFYFYKTQKGDKNLLYLLIGLTLSFVSLAAPVQLHGHSITLFWSAEAVLLYWLHQRSGIRIFKYSSALISALTLISLAMDWNNACLSNDFQVVVIFTGIRGIITNLVVVASFTSMYYLLKKDGDKAVYIWDIPVKAARTIMICIAVILLYITAIYSVNLYFGHTPDYIRMNPYHLLITDVFAIAIIAVLQKLTIKYTWLQLVLIIVCYLAFAVSIHSTVELRDLTLTGSYSFMHFFIHWVSDISLLYLVYKAILLFKNEKTLSDYRDMASWTIGVLLVIFFSVECMNLYVSAFYHADNIEYLAEIFSKAGLTILWGICSFAMMWLGMKNSYKTLRIISLVLFSITLLKLFFLDISDISEGGKIAAFILLGVLLLTISFMYQKIKKIIIDDKQK